MAADRRRIAAAGRAGTLRFRLTSIATLAVAAVLIGFAIALVAVQRDQLTETLDGSLQLRADTIAAGFADRIPDAPIPTDGEDRALQLVSGGGDVLVSSENLLDAAPLDSPLQDSEREALWSLDRLPFEDDPYRVLSRRVDTPVGPAVLHLAETSEEIDEALRDLAVALAVAVPAVIVLLAGVIWWLTGRALGPVETIRAEVDRITAGNSDRRVPLSGRDDEIDRLASTMNDMLDRLSDAADRQRRFVADAAHELRTPLTRIRTNVEVDLAQPDSAEPESTLRSVRDESIALQRLIDDLLHLARSDADRAATSTQPVDLDDIVLREVAEQRVSTAVTIDASGVSAAHLEADPEQLSRAVRNLLVNATQHADRTVTLTLTESDDHVELAVADDGPGVPLEFRERIFERFARIDDARSRSAGGTGLGLAITADIIARHGGTIGYDDDHTSGARFVVSLPTRSEQRRS